MKIIKKAIIILIVGMLVMTSMIGSVSGSSEVEKTTPTLTRGEVLYVGGSGPGNYSSITSALQNASENDTIYVFSGIYSEDRLLISISVSLIGQSNVTTIIDNSIFVFNTTNILLTGFCFQNFSGITIGSLFGNNVSCNTITNTIFTNVSLGLEIVNSCSNTIRNNRFDECGIFLVPFTIDDFTNTILNNIVNGKPLVYLEDATDQHISDAGQIILLRCRNITISQTSFGIGTSLLEFIQTTNTKMRNNDFKNTILYMINSSENTIADNRFYTPADELQSNGLLLFDQSNNNEITNNVFSHHSMIAISMSSDNSFDHNDFYGFLHLRPMVIFMDADNTWQRNFWMRPRILPKLIAGFNYSTQYYNVTKSFDIDWRPTLLPNNPTPNWTHNEILIPQKVEHPWITFEWLLQKNPMILR